MAKHESAAVYNLSDVSLFVVHIADLLVLLRKALKEMQRVDRSEAYTLLLTSDRSSEIDSG